MNAPDIHASVDAKVVAWRRDLHQNPELGNREFRTSKVVADHLRALGIEVQDNVAHTGVVGVLRGGLPGASCANLHPASSRLDRPTARTERKWPWRAS